MPRNKLDSLIQDIIPPLLVVLLTIVVIDLFYGFGAYVFLIDIFDIFVVIIFGIDLYFRWKDDPRLWPFLKNHYIDIIATIPFNLIFVGMDYAVFTRSLRGLRGAARMARVARMARLLRFVARAPRFLRLRKHVGKTELRDKQPHEKEMGGVLSFKVILLVTINSIMGTGIWFLTAAGAKHAGPASLVSWGVLTVIAIYISMCFSELTAMFPRAGGVYEFAKQTYGRLMSFIIGWTTSIA
ncbi:MAG: amino acid permease, partial [Nanoarchaeota archaeon]